MLTHEEFKARMLEDPEVLAEYERLRHTPEGLVTSVGARNEAEHAQVVGDNPKNTRE